MKSHGSEAVKINNNIMGAKTILIRVKAIRVQSIDIGLTGTDLGKYNQIVFN